jgi:hypothetical protein
MRRTRTEAEGEIMTGRDADGTAETEADHFMKCPGCGQWPRESAGQQLRASLQDGSQLDPLHSRHSTWPWF